MKSSSRAQRSEPFYVMEVAKAASQLAREFAHGQRPMIFLNIGEPDFTTPSHIRDAAKESLDRGETHYTANLGVLELRRAIAAKLARVNALAVDGYCQIIVTVDGVQALQLAVSAFPDPGDAVLIPDPCFLV